MRKKTKNEKEVNFNTSNKLSELIKRFLDGKDSKLTIKISDEYEKK